MENLNTGTPLISCSLTDCRKFQAHSHRHTEIIFLLSGNGRLMIEKECFKAKTNDFYIINADEVHSFSGDRDILYAYFKIDVGTMAEMGDFGDALFYSDPGEKAESGVLAQLRYLLMQVIRLQIMKDSFAPIMLNGYAYQILYIFVKYFRVELNKTSQDKTHLDKIRQLKIRHYLYSHYRESVSLHDLAEYMFLSDAYLSKYIKKYFGQNFLSYLNSIRMEYASIELVQHPERSVLQIALSNGFPNISSFNKCFQSIYKSTPTQYRKKELDTLKERKMTAEELAVLEKGKELIEEKLSNIESIPVYSQKTEFIGDTGQSVPLHRHWDNVLNGGRIGDLLRFDIQEQVLYLFKTLHFKYIRLWDFFSEEMLLNIEGNTEKEKYNFVKLDRVFDFLMKNNIKPFLEVAFKPIVLIKNLDENLIRQPRSCVFSSLGQYDSFLDQLVKHFCQRYGETEVNSWIFELWWSREQLDKSCEAYLRLFEHTAKYIKKHAPMALIGGAGFELLKSSLDLQQFLNQWKQSASLPDFLSVYAYPYNVNGDNELIDGRRVQNENYVRDWIKEVKTIACCAGFGEKRIFVTEWNCSVSSRNILHDSSFMGAYIIKNVLSTINSVDVLSYWSASDLYSEYYDLNSILYGGEGLLSRDGIRKPAFYAFDFLNHLGNDIIGYGEDYIITQVGTGDYRIVCCNYKHPNIRYFQEDENLQDVDRLNYIFTDRHELECDININGVVSGAYEIKIRRVNRDAGSVQDEWNRISVGSVAGEDDISYLKSICIPRISMQVMKCEDKLEFHTVLKEQEIQYIHIKLAETNV